MPKDQRSFTKEFKQEAVQLVQTSEKSMTQIAKDLGIADSIFSHWCKVYAQHGEIGSPVRFFQLISRVVIRMLKGGTPISSEEDLKGLLRLEIKQPHL